jgi:hypothetical protein
MHSIVKIQSFSKLKQVVYASTVTTLTYRVNVSFPPSFLYLLS